MTPTCSSLTTRPLIAADVARAARLLSHAFEIDPAYRYLFADAAARPAGLSDFFARNLRTHLPFRCTWGALDAAQRVVGTVSVRPPGGVHVSTLLGVECPSQAWTWRSGTPSETSGVANECLMSCQRTLLRPQADRPTRRPRAMPGPRTTGTAAETPRIDAPHQPEPAANATAADLLHAARAALPGEPRRAPSLIEEADARFGDDDEARRMLEIEVLVALGQIGRSRALTRHFYQRYPHSEAIAELERLTGYHPRPEPALNARRQRECGGQAAAAFCATEGMKPASASPG